MSTRPPSPTSPPSSRRSSPQARELLAGGKRFRALFLLLGLAVRRGHRRVRGPMPDAGGAVARRRPARGDLGGRGARALPRRRARARRHHGQTPTRAAGVRRPTALRVAAPRGGLGRRGRRLRHQRGRCCSATCCSAGATSSSTTASPASPTGRPRAAARAEFARMRTEVTVGQYLDILEEDCLERRARTARRCRGPTA